MITFHANRMLSGANGPFLLELKMEIQKGEMVALYGPSGAGKTSIIRMIAGFLKPEKGKIIVDGESWFDSGNKVNLPTKLRSIGMVFQEYSLFPNMTVRGNLEFALPRGEKKSWVDEMLDLVQMSAFAERRPKFLSGGQKQRVALARALVRKPKLLLLDEPLSALDFAMRAKLQQDILLLHKRLGLTTMLISHDFYEVKKLANRVLIIEEGKVVEDGKVEEILRDPFQ